MRAVIMCDGQTIEGKVYVNEVGFAFIEAPEIGRLYIGRKDNRYPTGIRFNLKALVRKIRQLGGKGFVKLVITDEGVAQ